MKCGARLLKGREAIGGWDNGLLYLVRVAPDCNRSYCEDSFSGYSGSVRLLYLLGCFYTPQWAGAEDGEGIRPAAGTGNE